MSQVDASIIKNMLGKNPKQNVLRMVYRISSKGSQLIRSNVSPYVLNFKESPHLCQKKEKIVSTLLCVIRNRFGNLLKYGW